VACCVMIAHVKPEVARLNRVPGGAA
jgi:hypothetical protein